MYLYLSILQPVFPQSLQYKLIFTLYLQQQKSRQSVQTLNLSQTHYYSCKFGLLYGKFTVKICFLSYITFFDSILLSFGFRLNDEKWWETWVKVYIGGYQGSIGIYIVLLTKKGHTCCFLFFIFFFFQFFLLKTHIYVKFVTHSMSNCVQVCALSSATCTPPKSVILTNILSLFPDREKLADLVKLWSKGLFSSH